MRTTHSVRVQVHIFAVMTKVIVHAAIRLASLTLLCALSDWKFLYNQQTAVDPFLKTQFPPFIVDFRGIIFASAYFGRQLFYVL